MPLPDSCPECEEREAALLELRSGLAYISMLVADLRLHLALKAGFNPDQPRDGHGRWTNTGNADRVAQVGVANGDLPEQRVDAFFGSVTGIEAYASTVRSQLRIRETYGVGVYIRQDTAARRGYRVITAYPRNLD